MVLSVCLLSSHISFVRCWFKSFVHFLELSGVFWLLCCEAPYLFWTFVLWHMCLAIISSQLWVVVLIIYCHIIKLLTNLAIKGIHIHLTVSVDHAFRSSWAELSCCGVSQEVAVGVPVGLFLLSETLSRGWCPVPVAGCRQEASFLPRALPVRPYNMAATPCEGVIWGKPEASGISVTTCLGGSTHPFCTDLFIGYPAALEKAVKNKKRQESLGTILIAGDSICNFIFFHCLSKTSCLGN